MFLNNLKGRRPPLESLEVLKTSNGAYGRSIFSNGVNMNNTDERLGMGWLPDYPDFRDYTEGHEEVRKMGRWEDERLGR